MLIVRWVAALALGGVVLAQGVLLWMSSKVLGLDWLEVARNPRLPQLLGITLGVWALGVVVYFARPAAVRRRHRLERRVLAITTATWATTQVLMCAGVPELARWLIEEPGFARYSEDVMTNPALLGQSPPDEVFGYERQRIVVDAQSVRYQIPRGGWFGEMWLVYSPSGEPASPKDSCRVRRYRGCWYIVDCTGS